MSKRTGNRTGRAAKRRRARHERKAGQGAALKAWLAREAPGALIFCRGGSRPIGLRTLARVTISVRHWTADMWKPRLPSFVAHDDFTNRLPSYRYSGVVRDLLMPGTPHPRVRYIDDI